MSDTERLRAALSDLYDYLRQRHPPRMGNDHYPPSLRPLMVAANEALTKPESQRPCPLDAEPTRCAESNGGHCAHWHAFARCCRCDAKPEPQPALESCSECGEAYRHALSCSRGANAVVRQPESQSSVVEHRGALAFNDDTYCSSEECWCQRMDLGVKDAMTGGLCAHCNNLPYHGTTLACPECGIDRHGVGHGAG